jgi:DNA ligase-1
MNKSKEIKILNDLKDLVDNLKESNSTNDKVEVLKSIKDNEDLKKLLVYMYNPYFKYYVTWKNIQKLSDLQSVCHEDIFGLLDKLRNREITGHTAIGSVNDYLERLPKELLPMMELIFARSLKARADSKLINRVYPGLIPTFDVALATKYEDYAHRFDVRKDGWMWSRKLDGVRVIMRIENGTIKYFSRQGKEFDTLDNITDAIADHSIMTSNVVLDGELCIVDDNGDENFTSVIKEIRRKDHTIKNPRFKVFDILTTEEFDSGISSEHRDFSARYDDIQWKLGNPLWDADFPIDIVYHEFVTDKEEIPYLLEQAEASGWEGIMLRKDVPYKGKRSNDILKVKKMHDEEYIVKDIETGPFRIIDKGTGLEAEIITMTNVIIEHKGNPVSVGSGFTIGDRQVYFNDPSKIVGKEITVQYFEESQDKTGKFSLRFPVCKTVYENGRQV